MIKRFILISLCPFFDSIDREDFPKETGNKIYVLCFNKYRKATSENDLATFLNWITWYFWIISDFTKSFYASEIALYGCMLLSYWTDWSNKCCVYVLFFVFYCYPLVKCFIQIFIFYFRNMIFLIPTEQFHNFRISEIQLFFFIRNFFFTFTLVNSG